MEKSLEESAKGPDRSSETLKSAQPARHKGPAELPELHLAALSGDAESVRELLDGGEDPNERASGGETPLALAARGGSMRACKLLLDAGADPNGAGADGIPALLYAVRDMGLEEVEFFIRKGANPNLDWNGGWTALHEACAEIRIDDEGPRIALALVGAGASLLARAPWKGRVSSVGWTRKSLDDLRRWGESTESLTPAQLARAVGNEEMASALEPLELAAREALALKRETQSEGLKARAERWRAERGEAENGERPPGPKSSRSL